MDVIGVYLYLLELKKRDEKSNSGGRDGACIQTQFGTRCADLRAVKRSVENPVVASFNPSYPVYSSRFLRWVKLWSSSSLSLSRVKQRCARVSLWSAADKAHMQRSATLRSVFRVWTSKAHEPYCYFLTLKLLSCFLISFWNWTWRAHFGSLAV